MTAGKDILFKIIAKKLQKESQTKLQNSCKKTWVTSLFTCSIIDIPAPDCHNKYRNGDIAQLGERCLRKAEAEGSNPFISTMTLMRAETLRVFYTYICLGRYDGRRETLG